MGPAARIDEYFRACSVGSASDIAGHFTTDAVIWDTNIRPVQGNETIAAMWLQVRHRWSGAVWTVDSIVESGDGATAAIEWQMTGSDPTDSRQFVFRGSEHYQFEGSLIAEIRQYWTFDPNRHDTSLVDYQYD